jgi:hypothetical protein
MPRQTQWENYMDLSTEWIPLDVEVVRATGVAKLEKQSDGSLFATPLPEGQMALGNYQLKANTTLNGITGIKLEVLPDERLPGNGPGLATDGNFVLSEFLVSQSPLNAKRAKGSKAGAIAISKAFADFEQKSFAVTEALKAGNRNRGWAVSPEGGFRHEAVFLPAKPVTSDGGSTLTIQIVTAFQNGQYNLGRFRLWITTAANPRFGAPQAIIASMKTPAAKRSKEQQAQLRDFFLAQDRSYQTAQKTLATVSKPLPADPQRLALEAKNTDAQKPILIDPVLVQLRRDIALSEGQLLHKRLTATQDLAWALINSPAFLFNH